MLKVYKKKKNSFKIKRKIDDKINFYSRYMDCGFKRFETLAKKELSDLLKV